MEFHSAYEFEDPQEAFESALNALFDGMRLDARQRRYIRARLDDEKPSKAAEIAGFSCDVDGAYHVVGHKTEARKWAKTALARARKLQEDPVEGIGDIEELHGLVWHKARGGDIRAMELCWRIEERRLGQPKDERAEVSEIVAEIWKENAPLARLLARAAPIFDEFSPRDAPGYVNGHDEGAAA